MVTKTYRVYGRDGHRQAVSFSKSFDIGDYIKVNCRDITGTNDYTELVITKNTEGECIDELDAQTVDGIFEGSRTGRIYEVVEGREVYLYGI